MPFEKTEKIWMDGALVPWDEARVHVLTHSLHYGSGVFEGIRTYATADGPAVFRLTDHIERLLDSAKLIMMEIPYSREELVEACKLTVRASGLDSCYVRPIAFLGYGEIGLNPLPCAVNVAIAAWPWGAYLGEQSLATGVRVKISSWRRMVCHRPSACSLTSPRCSTKRPWRSIRRAKVSARRSRTWKSRASASRRSSG